jgi:hypothetical protein
MAQDNIDSIFKSLRVLPEFDGNPHVLTRFINLCDQLVLTYFSPEAGYELQNLALINGILNKVTGPASRLINSNGIPETWLGIRSALINNFADHRDETALYNDLSLQTQGSSTPQEFYEKCQNLFSTIMTYVSLNEAIPTTIEAKRTLYQKLTLQAYLRGLKDPLGYRIRCMRPETMEKALQFVQEELNTLYMQQRSESGPSKREWQQPPPQHNRNSVPFLMPPRQPVFNMPGPSRPNVVPPQAFQGWRPNPSSQMQSPRGPSRTQQMMRAPLPNYNPQSNVFRMPNRFQSQNQSQNQHRPMSGVSHFVPRTLPPTGRQDLSNFTNPPPSNYFRTREINFNELGYDYDPYHEYDYGCDQTSYPYDYLDYPYYEEQSCYLEPAIVEEVVDTNSVPVGDVNFQESSKSEKPK